MGDFANTFRNAYVGAFNPRARAMEQEQEQLTGAASLYDNYYKTAEANGIKKGTPEFFQGLTQMANTSGNPYMMQQLGLAYEKDQQNYAFNPQADPMLTSDLKEYVAVTGDAGLQDRAGINAYLQAMNSSKATKITMPKIDFQMPGNSQDRYLTADEMKTLVDKDGNVFPFGTAVSQAYAAGARPKSEAKAEQMKAGTAAQTMKLAEDQYSKNEMTEKERTPAFNSDYLITGLQNMFLDVPIPQVIKAPIVGERAQARKSAQDFWVEFPLRSETGATIQDIERETWADMHFPKQGNNNAEVARKKDRRVLLQTIKERVATGMLPNSFVDVSLLPDGSTRIAQVQLQGMDAPAQLIMSPEGGYMIKSAQGNYRSVGIDQLNEILKGGQK